MESTERTRIWHSGPPPHVGWWNASYFDDYKLWRWWDGERWSRINNPDAKVLVVNTYYLPDEIRWNDYYPANARVPRVNPDDDFHRYHTQPETVKYHVYEAKDMGYGMEDVRTLNVWWSNSKRTKGQVENTPHFIRWIGDEQTLENT